jgi:FixJ family two-component response regulator
MTMPQMTGDKFAKELMAIRNDIPIILCTGFSHAMTQKEVQDTGIKGFLMKPLKLQELSENVRKVPDANGLLPQSTN